MAIDLAFMALISLVGISIHAQVSSGTPRMQFWALLKIALLGLAKGHRKIDFGAVFWSGGHFLLAGHSKVDYIVTLDLRSEPLYG